MLININPDNIDDRLINKVIEILKNGGVIIFPTDTVYAMGCDLYNKKGLQELARLKGVKLSKAFFSIICNDLSNISKYVKYMSRPIFKLLKQNLPGPFTFIFQSTNEIPKLFDSNRKEIGIRVPNNTIILKIVEKLGNPITVTSLLNEEDEILEYFVDPNEIYERYFDKVSCVIDGGSGKLYGSTVIDCTSEFPEIIRQGAGVIDN
jgi:tRNA threonylcarbamoyl adenosine modification protein (Sua5/YciO/YrdC/YwlC family)